MKVLVVEDQPDELKLTIHVLSSAGYSVVGAGTAEDVFAFIARDRPQVVVLDMVLPGMDGLQLARKLKADPATKEIPLLAVTSVPELYPRADALAAGCDAYLMKPLSTRTLPKELSDLVKGK